MHEAASWCATGSSARVRPQRGARPRGLRRAAAYRPEGFATRRSGWRMGSASSTRRDADVPNPLNDLAAFARFQEGSRERCVPTGRWSRQLHEVGSYRFHGDEGPALMGPSRHPVVHLELHTGDREGASAFYADLCAGARSGSMRAAPVPRAGAGRRLRGRDRRVPVAPPGLAALRRGRSRRRGHRPRGAPRRLRPARAARGAGGLAQRRGDARGRRDRLLAAQGPARRLGCGMTERELLDAARGGDEDAFARLVEPHRGLLALIATACSARSTMPRTPCRTRCCAPGARSRASRGAARCGRGCTRSPPTSA